MFTMSFFYFANKRITTQCHSIIDICTKSINEDIPSGVIMADVCDHLVSLSIIQRLIYKKEHKQYLRANSKQNIGGLKLNFVFSA